MGLEGLRKIRHRVKFPILAIGGISAANAAKVISAGADGVAVISAITSAKNPKRAAVEMLETIKEQKG